MGLGLVNLNIEYYPDPTVGRPVFNGSIYVGVVNLDPVIEANRVTVYIRQEGAADVPILPSAQPLTTGGGGVILYNGSPAKLLVDGNYSLKVLNNAGTQVYYISNAFNEATASTSAIVVSSKAIANSLTVVDGRKVFITSSDGGEFTMKTGQPVGTLNDNGGAFTGTKFTNGDGSSGLKRDNANLIDPVWFGADNTGVALSNAAFDLSKTASSTLNLYDGTFRLENYDMQSIALVGVKPDTSVDGGAIITGDGDLLTNFAYAALTNLTIRNTTTEGKLITAAPGAIKIGQFENVSFGKSTYHIFQDASSTFNVAGSMVNCKFKDASIWSRFYSGALVDYSEAHCYTWFCQNGLYIENGETVLITDSVFEIMNDAALYISSAINTATYVTLSDTRFEANGQTVAKADIQLEMFNGSGLKVIFNNLKFAASSVATNVSKASTGSNSAELRFSNNTGLVVDKESSRWRHYERPAESIVYTGIGSLVSNMYNVVNPSNIRGLWVMDKNNGSTVIADRSGNGHNLFLKNISKVAVVASVLTPEINGLAPNLNFINGNNLSVTDNADFTFGDGSNDTAFSIVWLGKLSGSTLGQRIISKYDNSTPGKEWSVTYQGASSGDLTFLCYDQNNTSYISRIAPGALTDATQFHTIITTKAASAAATDMKIYVDGAQVDTTTDAPGGYVAMSAQSVELGSYFLNSGVITDPLDGRVAALMIIGEELTAIQIRQLSFLLRGYAGEVI